MNNVFCIVPAFNKENMIKSVLDGILDSTSKNTNIICIVDGCTDHTYDKIIEFKNTHKKTFILTQNNVHEILCLNTGLNFIKDELNPVEDDLVFMVQDDVILKEKNIDKKFKSLFLDNNSLGYVSMRLGLSISMQNDSIVEYDYMESEFGHWNELQWNIHKSIPHNSFIPVEIAVRSPTCVLWERFKNYGFFDPNMAPCGFDCYEFSLRMNEAGFTNALYTMKYESQVYWGTMRDESNHIFNGEHIVDIYNRNKKYLAKKYKNYFNSK